MLAHRCHQLVNPFVHKPRLKKKAIHLRTAFTVSFEFNYATFFITPASAKLAVLAVPAVKLITCPTGA